MNSGVRCGTYSFFHCPRSSPPTFYFTKSIKSVPVAKQRKRARNLVVFPSSPAPRLARLARQCRSLSFPLSSCSSTLMQSRNFPGSPLSLSAFLLFPASFSGPNFNASRGRPLGATSSPPERLSLTCPLPCVCVFVRVCEGERQFRAPFPFRARLLTGVGETGRTPPPF